MSELISGKEALEKITSGEVQYVHPSETQDRWTTITNHYYQQYHLGMFLDLDSEFKFRLKPETIKLTIEVPKPFKPKAGEQYFTLDTSCSDDYDSQKYSYPFNHDVGLVWRTEDEIKQVVAELRKLKGE